PRMCGRLRTGRGGLVGRPRPVPVVGLRLGGVSARERKTSSRVGAAQSDAVDLHAAGVEVADGLGRQLGSAGDRGGQLARVLDDGDPTLAELDEDGPGRVEVFPRPVTAYGANTPAATGRRRTVTRYIATRKG
ncbi:hypothetical protein, partial [Streptomyces atratus]|uniref:hypothetical protein n=1 Tax=Streptomyces atratus TaxID=1893 RepID=UPI0036625128